MGGETPEANPTLYANRSPITHIDDLTTPTLLQHGADDDIAPVAVIRRVVRQVIGERAHGVVLLCRALSRPARRLAVAHGRGGKYP